MDKLSIKQKAKAYDEALEKARQLCAYPTTKSFISDLQDLFPELKESEDEGIRKELVAFIKKRDRSGCDYDYDKWIDWLEKQGEQNLIMAKSPQLGEQKPAWSEEDELKRSTLIHVVKKLQGSAIFEGLLPEELIAWLKSLKQRIKL